MGVGEFKPRKPTQGWVSARPPPDVIETVDVSVDREVIAAWEGDSTTGHGGAAREMVAEDLGLPREESRATVAMRRSRLTSTG
jgi:hypothetical protein